MNRFDRLTTTDADAITLRVASGFSDRVAQTWSPSLPRTPRVLVPIGLDVLMVREDGAQWADCGMTAPAFTGGTQQGTPAPLESLLPSPFAELATGRPRGAYLHWSLPRALRSGAASAGELNFPPIADRWAVLRLSPSQRQGDRRAVRGWILEADAASPQPKDLAGWKEPGANAAMLNPLSALGHGDLSWMGYYDNVLNRMAFYDPLSDLAEGPIAYLVCGWYVAAANDPLADANITSLAGFDAKLAELGWEIPDAQLQQAATQAGNAAALYRGMNFSLAGTAAFESHFSTASTDDRYVIDGQSRLGAYVSDGSWWPRQTVFHGSCVAIGWPGIGWPGNENGLLSGEEGGPPAAGGIAVCFGNTLAEAMGTLIARANGVPDEARVLEAFELGITADLDQPDGRALIDVQQHASTFGSMAGGSKKAPFHQAASGPPEAAKPVTATPGPGVFAGRASPPAFEKTVAANERAVPLGKVIVPAGTSAQAKAERNVSNAGWRQVAASVVISRAPQPSPAADIEVDRMLPRFFFPNDPTLLIEGAKRSFKFEDEGRFSQNGKLQCRLTGFVMTATKSFEPTATDPQPHDDTPTVGGDAALENGIDNGSVPSECEDLLRETVLLDPGSAVAIAHATTRFQTARAAALTRFGVATPSPAAAPQSVANIAGRLIVEQTAWWATRDPRADHAQLIARSSLSGTLPAALAVTPPALPWAPVHVDWAVDYLPSGLGHTGWNLQELEYVADVSQLPVAGALRFTGRSPVTNAAGNALASAIRLARDALQRSGGTEPLPQDGGHIAPPHYAQQLEKSYSLTAEAASVRVAAAGVTAAGTASNAATGAATGAEFDDIASAIDKVDILSAALDGLHAKLRGGFAPDGKAAPPDGSTPTPFVPFRAGFLRFVRLRVVDGFGQFVDLLGSGAQSTVDPERLLLTEPVTTPGQPGIAALPPRFNTPARLWFRFVSATNDDVEADGTTSPVCGFVMPDHLDGSLEFFDPDGSNAGMIRVRDDTKIVWEDAPGRQPGIGQTPVATLANAAGAALATSLLDWGVGDAGDPSRENALDALLRTIDSTRWTVDPYGHVGDEHLALLVGHPVVIVRAMLRLDVLEPIPSIESRTTAVPVRLGALTQWQDGLFGFFANDDYTTLYASDAAIAGLARDFGRGRGFLQPITDVAAYAASFADTSAVKPIAHPYIDTSGSILVRPGQTIRLTLLVEPHTSIHATTGLLPRKEIGLRREWVDEALKKLAPTFRFGPVLVDPKRIRMPVASDLSGVWSWDHRDDAVAWQDQSVTKSTQDATLAPDPPSAQEGWLRLSPPAPTPANGASSS